MKSTLLTVIIVIATTSMLIGQKNYEEALKKGDAALQRKEFKTALDYYQAAEAFDPGRVNEVTIKIKRLFDEVEKLDEEVNRQRTIVERALQRVDSIALINQATLDSLVLLRGQMDSINNIALSKKIRSDIAFIKAKMELLIQSKQYKEAKEALSSSYDLIKNDPLLTDEGLLDFENEILRENTSRIDSLINIAEAVEREKEKKVRRFRNTLSSADSLRQYDFISAYNLYKSVEKLKIDNDLLKKKIDSLYSLASTLTRSEVAYLLANLYHTQGEKGFSDYCLAILLYNDFSFSAPDTMQFDDTNIKFLPEVEKRLKQIKKKRKRNVVSLRIFGLSISYEKTDIYRNSEKLSRKGRSNSPLNSNWGISYEYLFRPRWSFGANFSYREDGKDSFNLVNNQSEIPFNFRPSFRNSSSYLSLLLGYHQKENPLFHQGEGHFYLKGGMGIRFSRINYKINGASTNVGLAVGDTTLVIVLREDGFSKYRKIEPYFETTLGFTGLVPFKEAGNRRASFFVEVGFFWAPDFGKDLSAYSKTLFNDLHAYKLTRTAETSFQRLADVPVPQTYTENSQWGEFSFREKDISISFSIGFAFSF